MTTPRGSAPSWSSSRPSASSGSWTPRREAQIEYALGTRARQAAAAPTPDQWRRQAVTLQRLCEAMPHVNRETIAASLEHLANAHWVVIEIRPSGIRTYSYAGPLGMLLASGVSGE